MAKNQNSKNSRDNLKKGIPFLINSINHLEFIISYLSNLQKSRNQYFLRTKNIKDNIGDMINKLIAIKNDLQKYREIRIDAPKISDILKGAVKMRKDVNIVKLIDIILTKEKEKKPHPLLRSIMNKASACQECIKVLMKRYKKNEFIIIELNIAEKHLKHAIDNLQEYESETKSNNITLYTAISKLIIKEQKKREN